MLSAANAYMESRRIVIQSETGWLDGDWVEIKRRSGILTLKLLQISLLWESSIRPASCRQSARLTPVDLYLSGACHATQQYLTFCEIRRTNTWNRVFLRFSIIAKEIGSRITFKWSCSHRYTHPEYIGRFRHCRQEHLSRCKAHLSDWYRPWIEMQQLQRDSTYNERRRAAKERNLDNHTAHSALQGL